MNMPLNFTLIDLEGIFDAGSVNTYNSCPPAPKELRTRKREITFFMIVD